MHTISNFYFFRFLIALLASISLLNAATALPLKSDYMTLVRRVTITVDGKEGKLGERLSPESHAKSTVHRLDTWDGQSNPGYVVKLYNQGSVKQNEIDNLKAVGQHIASDSNGKSIVMKEVQGTSLAQMVGEVKDHAKRKQFIEEWRPKIADAAAKIAQEKGLYHADLNMNNAVVSKDGAVQLIDWEHAYKKGQQGFLDDKESIQKTLSVVWDSSATPPEYSSPTCSRELLEADDEELAIRNSDSCSLPPDFFKRRETKAKATGAGVKTGQPETSPTKKTITKDGAVKPALSETAKGKPPKALDLTSSKSASPKHIRLNAYLNTSKANKSPLPKIPAKRTSGSFKRAASKRKSPLTKAATKRLPSQASTGRVAKKTSSKAKSILSLAKSPSSRKAAAAKSQKVASVKKSSHVSSPIRASSSKASRSASTKSRSGRPSTKKATRQFLVSKLATKGTSAKKATQPTSSKPAPKSSKALKVARKVQSKSGLKRAVDSAKSKSTSLARRVVVKATTKQARKPHVRPAPARKASVPKGLPKKAVAALRKAVSVAKVVSKAVKKRKT